MSTFTLDGTGVADTSDPQAILDSYDSGGSGADASLGSMDGISYGAVGAGYGFATGGDTVGSSASSQTLGQLQSGGSTIDWTSILQGGMSALIAADSIQHGLSVSGQALPTYKAPNGAVYPVGQGPMQSSGSGFMMLLIIGIVLFAVVEEKK